MAAESFMPGWSSCLDKHAQEDLLDGVRMMSSAESRFIAEDALSTGKNPLHDRRDDPSGIVDADDDDDDAEEEDADYDDDDDENDSKIAAGAADMIEVRVSIQIPPAQVISLRVPRNCTVQDVIHRIAKTIDMLPELLAVTDSQVNSASHMLKRPDDADADMPVLGEQYENHARASRPASHKSARKRKGASEPYSTESVKQKPLLKKDKFATSQHFRHLRSEQRLDLDDTSLFRAHPMIMAGKMPRVYSCCTYCQNHPIKSEVGLLRCSPIKTAGFCETHRRVCSQS